MKRFTLAAAAVLTGSLGVFAVTAAASPLPAPPNPATPAHPAPSKEATGARVVELPAAAGPGQPKDVQVLVDEAALKLATIVLRRGTVLPQHSSPVPVTILALQGSGTVTTGTERLPLNATHAVVLAPNVPHGVEPDAGTDMVLLVHHLGHGEKAHP